MAARFVDTIRQLARYNRLANDRLYASCAELSDAARKQTRPAFFKSIHGTLNHIMVGDRIWLARFEGREAPSTRLDAILYEDFEADFAASVTDAFLAGTVQYENNEGRIFDDPADMLVSHFFNYQTHHRGQVHDMLCQTDVTPPVLDLHRVLKPNPDS
jgi:uncharacterized damage-inducible protein DinB